MKKLVIILIMVFVGVNLSSCQTNRRGIQFYSGDKNTVVIENQLSLTQEKKDEYEIKLNRMKRERDRILSGSEQEINSEISRLENENRRLNAQLRELKGSSQRADGSSLLHQIEEIEKKISQNEDRLSYLYQSDRYPSRAKALDEKIDNIAELLFDLQIVEDQMLAKMTREENLDFFQGNIRNGYEGANAYMLMKWAQEPVAGTAINSQGGKIQAVIVNEFHRGVTAVIRHSSGVKFPDIPMDAKSSTIIDLPFPGEYVCYFRRGNQRGSIIIKHVNPRLLVDYKGKKYGFVLTQRGY